jgi:hypothetical protein
MIRVMASSRIVRKGHLVTDSDCVYHGRADLHQIYICVGYLSRVDPSPP